MNRTEHLLSCFAEECAEVAQRVSKALRFGLDEVQPGQYQTNAVRIQSEFNDLVAVAVMLRNEGVPLELPSHDICEAKRKRVEKFITYAESVGALTTPNQDAMR